MRRQAAERAELVTLRPVALKTEPSPAYTFTGLFEHWRGGENDKPETWRIKGPRHTASTARLLEKCFPARDYRSIDVKDAIYFADWLHEKGIGPASQMNHLSSARAMYKAAWKLMHDKPNPFEKVKAVADHTSAARGKFTYAQLRNILRVAATPGANGYRWADNRVEKRHDEALWMLRLAIYTGARISEIAALQVADLKTYDDGKVTFPYLYFRPEIVKAQKDEDKSRETPLHPDIAAEFVAFVKSVKGPNIFAGFGGKANWIVSNFPAFLRDNAEALGIKLADGKPVEHNKGRPLCQHCLRHTLHKAMNDSRINPIAQRVFVGRKGKDVHDSVYATDMGLAELYKDVCQMKPLG
jgi:integrase